MPPLTLCLPLAWLTFDSPLVTRALTAAVKKISRIVRLSNAPPIRCDGRNSALPTFYDRKRISNLPRKHHHLVGFELEPEIDAEG